jgi:hypothetical protein
MSKRTFTDWPGPRWLLPGKSVAQQLHEHQRLADGAHALALGDGVAQALVGGGGGGGMGGCWRLPGDRARFVFGRPVRPSPLLGSLLALPPQSPTQGLMTKGTQGLRVLP